MTVIGESPSAVSLCLVFATRRPWFSRNAPGLSRCRECCAIDHVRVVLRSRSAAPRSGQRRASWTAGPSGTAESPRGAT
jgi:hypothetical protein